MKYYHHFLDAPTQSDSVVINHLLIINNSGEKKKKLVGTITESLIGIGTRNDI